MNYISNFDQIGQEMGKLLPLSFFPSFSRRRSEMSKFANPPISPSLSIIWAVLSFYFLFFPTQGRTPECDFGIHMWFYSAKKLRLFACH